MIFLSKKTILHVFAQILLCELRLLVVIALTSQCNLPLRPEQFDSF